MDLAGKVALVTGGAQRVGRVISLALARAGAHIALNHWQTGEDARKTCSDIQNLGVRCVPIEADISDVSHVEGIIDVIQREFGRLDILVHNASNFNQCEFMSVSEDMWDSSFNVNLKGPFFLSQAAARLMLQHGSGRIISLVGNSYYENWPNFIPHTIAKTGLARLTQALAVALSPHIQCNAICPASILPSQDGQDVSIMSARGETHSSSGVECSRGVWLHQGCPEEVAELVVYLAGCSNYLTGAVIPIDGGKSAV